MPGAIGLCASDAARIAAAVNPAEQELINAGGETGWWGGWAKVLFTASKTTPYVTLPRRYARAINMAVCNKAIALRNEFFEELESGVGLRPGTPCSDWCGSVAGYERGAWPTMVEMTKAPQLLRAYLTDSRDADKTMLISGTDQNGNEIYPGTLLTLGSPFVTSDFTMSSITAVIKDLTHGDVLLKQVDPDTGEEVTLSRYGPDETVPAYRRYYIDRLPNNCCGSTDAGTVQITALCKYEHLPVSRDTDLLVIGSIPALESQVQALRYRRMDTGDAAGLEIKSQRKAIKLLQAEQRHYLGEQSLAVVIAPYGCDGGLVRSYGRML